ncbi:hypothetical protein FRX31_023192 [Thalictrum thalictroides]|uniref:VQ domain-containing protein n=1 Tax=Thalictrum thalictroides TaxID=46969 RepID=A0A7J6VR26_THATH|nr:hypothetical protein FRX31_023192 [Thalictrum thalictroides]
MNLPKESTRNLDYQSTTVLKKRRNDKMNCDGKYRKPTIIYLETPKVIHADEQHFMSLVQKLTGMNSKPDSGLKTSKISSSALTMFNQERATSTTVSTHRSSMSTVSSDDDQLVSGGFYRSLVVDEADLYLSPPY